MTDIDKVNIKIGPDMITFIAMTKTCEMLGEWIEHMVPPFTPEREEMIQMCKTMVEMAADNGLEI